MSIKGRNNPYSVLGITKYTSEEDAKKAYRKLCKEYHPDNSISGDGEKFREVNEAWNYLQGLGSKAFGNKKEVAIHKTVFKSKWRII